MRRGSAAASGSAGTPRGPRGRTGGDLRTVGKAGGLLARPWGTMTPRRRSTPSSSSARTITGRGGAGRAGPGRVAEPRADHRGALGRGYAHLVRRTVRRRWPVGGLGERRADEPAAGGQRRTPVRDLRTGPVRERGRDTVPRGVDRDGGGADPPYARRAEGRSRGRASALAPARTGAGAAPGRSPGEQGDRAVRAMLAQQPYGTGRAPGRRTRRPKSGRKTSGFPTPVPRGRTRGE